MNTILPLSNQDSPGAIMFHHFHGSIFNLSPGSISASDLERLLDSINNKNLISADRWVDKFLNDSLNYGDVCLSFDDNLKCQYEIALPVLKKRNLKAFWFIHTAVFDGHSDILEMYRHFRSEYFPNYKEFFSNFLQSIKYFGLEKKASNALNNFIPEREYKTNPYLSNDEKRFRLLRDEVLNREEYIKVMERMIIQVGVSKEDLNSNLYMTTDNIRELSNDGNIIGLHSHNHHTKITSLSNSEKNYEYTKNYNIIKSIINKNPFAMSHPCNLYDENIIEILKKLGIIIGFRANTLGNYNSNYELPRHNHANLMKKINL